MTSSLTTIARGESSGIVESQRAIVRDAAQWRALWAAHAGPAAPAPDVDFTSHMVAAVFAGERPTPGFEIEVTGTARDGQALTLAVKERSPAPDMIAAQVLVSPFHIVRIPRYDGEVRFVDGTAASSEGPAGLHPTAQKPRGGDPGLHPTAQKPRGGDPGLHSTAQKPRGGDPGLTAGATREPGAATGDPNRAGPLVGATPGPLFGAPPAPKVRASRTRSGIDGPSSTGLDPNFAAALAYLAGPFSGILILLVERSNNYVRFHAWQAIVGLGGLGVLAVGVLVLSFLTLLLSPFIFTVMYRLSEVIAIVWVVAWVMCLVKAYTGHKWKMPVAGRYAQKLAARRS